MTISPGWCRLTGGAAPLVLDGDWRSALGLSGQAGAPQPTAVPVRDPVATADLVVALARTHSLFVLLVCVAFGALQPGAAAAGPRAAPSAGLALRSRTD